MNTEEASFKLGTCHRVKQEGKWLRSGSSILLFIYTCNDK